MGIRLSDNQARAESTARQSGWSLPLTWILLAMLVAAYLLFGWTGPLILVGLMALVAGVLMIRNALRPGAAGGPAGAVEADFWFESAFDIEAVAERLAAGFNLDITRAQGARFRIESDRYRFNLTQVFSSTGGQPHLYVLNIASDDYHLGEGEQPFVASKLASILDTRINAGDPEAD